MHILRDIDDLPDAARRGAVAVGNFDGVHRGHARIVDRLVAMARQVAGPAVVFTFDPHPVRILRPRDCPPPLTWTERKAHLLSRLGIDWIVVYPTDQQLLSLTPEQFFEHLIVERLDARAMVEGTNFCFGRNREGTVDVLRALADSARVRLDIVPPLMIDDEPVSSSRIRTLLARGHAEDACRMLTAPYRIRGMVTHGAGRGAKIGFPTANIDAVDTLLPGDGVYGGVAHANGGTWPAAINIGPNPTFGQIGRKIEAHLVGATMQLYGRVLEVDFLSRLRDIHPFASVDDLREQLARDVERAREIAEAALPPGPASHQPPAS